jgi:tetratricopeptide (TPR) repeat protein
MKDHLIESGIVSTLSEPREVENGDARSTTLKRSRGHFLIALKVIISLLAVASASYAVAHFISTSGDAKWILVEQQQGVADAGTGECAQAIILLTWVIASYPNDLVTKEALAGCYLAQHNFDSATALLQDVASSAPDLSNEMAVANAAFFSGNTALVQSALKVAVAHAITASDSLSIADAASSYGLYSIAGTALYRTQYSHRTYIWYETDAKVELDLGNPRIAVTAAIRAARLSPHSTRASILVDLGNTYVGASEYENAANAYRNALSMDQQIDTVSVYSELSQCYIELGRYPAAIAAAQSGIAISTDEDQYNLELTEATALADQHHSQGAVKLLNAIIAAKSAPANVVSSASALLSAIDD